MIAKENQESGSNIHDDYTAMLQKYMNKGAEAAQPSQEKKAQQDEVDAIVLDLLEQVMTESGGIHPESEPAKAESLHLSVDTLKPKTDISKPAPEKVAVKESPTEKPSTAKASPAPVASKPATPVSAFDVAQTRARSGRQPQTRFFRETKKQNSLHRHRLRLCVGGHRDSGI